MTNNSKTVLVTGATRGIGRGIASKFIKNGYAVYGTATSPEGADLISEELQSEEGFGRGLSMNVNNPESIKSVIKTIEEERGVLSILINNAGITKDNLLMRLSQEDWDDVIQTNLSGVFKVCKAVSRSMIKARYGRIINITSVVGHTGNAGQANYSASKAGIISFSKSLAKEVGSRGITVNCVSPGFIKTDMTEVLTEQQKNSVLDQIPIGKFGEANDVAEAVFFLAGDMASYITGSTIHVNGGMLME